MHLIPGVLIVLALSGCNAPSSPPPSAPSSLAGQSPVEATHAERQAQLNVLPEQKMPMPAQEPHESVLRRQGRCVKDSIGKTICAPAGGGARIDRLGQVVCGPGQCEVNALGEIKCAAQSGGGAMLDGSGQVVCVGGCVEARMSFCQNTH